MSNLIKQRSKVINLSLPNHQKITFFVILHLKSIKKPSKLRAFHVFLKYFYYALFSVASIKT